MSSPSPFPNRAEIPDIEIDELSSLELRIARLADALARAHPEERERDYWFQAERAVLVELSA
ncbi:hypothetical protein K0B96_09585 [Horticoccus luteus]|uniref:Uncharacterized protein n=1 Tax=Horticoccus luteus TaxID=2862869 RepID=A0A8F9TR00_9BACT|nr:hypothetical protein [Horticoccus luteus]QYM77579.1 hypothetical protein K0B96_09585 [Horticoccus luteus]